MLRLTDVALVEIAVPLHTPFVTALRSTTKIATVGLRVTDSDGRVGWGEAPAVWRVTGESRESARACLEGPLRDALLAAPVADLSETCRRIRNAVVGNNGAKSAADVAVHDLAAQRAGLPLSAFLAGQPVSLSVPTDVTLSAGESDALAAAAHDRCAEGFTALKLKVGTDARTDVARVLAVRAAVGPGVRLRLDANQGWRADEAVRIIQRLEDAGADVEVVEQPVPADDLEGLAFVTDRVDTPVMADETVFGLVDLVEVIRRRAADLVNVKLAKCGGLDAAVELLAVCRSHGIGTMVGSMMESHLGVGAAASLVAAFPTTLTSDLDAAWWAAGPAYHGGMSYDGPVVVLPEAPGLGIEGLR